jgi:hypothetical protein
MSSETNTNTNTDTADLIKAFHNNPATSLTGLNFKYNELLNQKFWPCVADSNILLTDNGSPKKLKEKLQEIAKYIDKLAENYNSLKSKWLEAAEAAAKTVEYCNGIVRPGFYNKKLTFCKIWIDSKKLEVLAQDVPQDLLDHFSENYDIDTHVTFTLTTVNEQYVITNLKLNE